MPPGFKSVVNGQTISFVSGWFVSSSTYVIKETCKVSCACISFLGGGEEKEASNILIESNQDRFIKRISQNIIPNLPYQLCPTHAKRGQYKHF